MPSFVSSDMLFVLIHNWNLDMTKFHAAFIKLGGGGWGWTSSDWKCRPYITPNCTPGDCTNMTSNEHTSSHVLANTRTDGKSWLMRMIWGTCSLTATPNTPTVSRLNQHIIKDTSRSLDLSSGLIEKALVVGIYVTVRYKQRELQGYQCCKFICQHFLPA